MISYKRTKPQMTMFPAVRKKAARIKWIAMRGKFLSKITIQITRLPNGELGSGVVQFTPAKVNSK